MTGAGRTGLLLLAMVLAMCAAWPLPKADAAQINRVSIRDVDAGTTATYLVAGRQYDVLFDTDKAFSTYIENVKLEYSTDNGVIWINLPLPGIVNGFWSSSFRLPNDPGLDTILLRFSMYFDPLLGSRTYSEKIMGPYKVLHAVDASDFTATPNDDGSVTLRWQDNSNMESYYRITRSGPDGDRTYQVTNTRGNYGSLEYVDRQTNTSKSTVYVYALTPVVDRYVLPADLWLGTVWMPAKTKVPIRDVTKVEINPNIPILKQPDVIVTENVLVDPDLVLVKPDTPIREFEIYKYLEGYDLSIGDLLKPSVSGVKLDQRSIAVLAGESQQLLATVTPADAANRNVVWSSDNDEVAVVDGTGKVTGKSPGVAAVTVKTEVGAFTAVAVVTVIADNDAAPLPPELPVIAFDDLAGHKAEAEVKKAVSLGIVTGYPDGTFRPEGSVTRAEFASMLMRVIDSTDAGEPLAFKDKAAIGGWAVEAVQKAVKRGIIGGYSDGSFRPNANITHAEMVAMVVRASGLPLGEAKQTGFADDAEIPGWAKPAASTAEETGIIIVGGLPDGKFAPQALTTRAEAVSAIVRMLEAAKK
jgi:hypothetical protein